MARLSLLKNRFEINNLTKRTVSAAIAGPIVVGTIILGTPYIDILSLILTSILLWEWSKMSDLPLSHPMNGIVLILQGWTIWGTGSLLPSFVIIGSGILYTLFYHYQIGNLLFHTFILLSGPLYIGVGMTAILHLGKFYSHILLWGLFIIWATDTGAYLVGNWIKGPKLVPKISPGKTWSGFFGGSTIGSLLGLGLAPYCHIHIKSQSLLVFLCLTITIIGHLGDILESAAKRFFKVKDSSHILPGHGGLLDRVDSLLLVALFLTTLKFFNLF